MYKVLIVDDERWVAESIFQCIDWKINAFDVIGISSDGIEAYSRIMQDHPDIVLLDIRMPKMNGLDLITKVNEAGMDVKFIIISGHAEFSYAQKAMKEKAIGYCLKPVNQNELLDLLGKARDMLETKQAGRHIMLFDMLMNDTPDLHSETEGYLHEYGMDFTNKNGIIAVVSHGNNPVHFKNSCKSIVGGFGNGKYAYLIQTEDNNLFFDFPVDYLEGPFKSLGVGQIAATMVELKKSLEEAYLSSYQFFIRSEGGVFKYIPLDTRDMETLVLRINGYFQNNEIENVIHTIQCMPEFFKAEGYHIKHILYLFNFIMQRLYKSTDQLMEKYLFSYDQLTGMFANIEEMTQALTGYVTKHFSQTTKDFAVANDRTMKRILSYTKEHFTRDISLGELSRKFYINPSYISQMFKKELGQNFTDYVLSLRIHYACVLMKDLNMPLLELSRKVGYNDYFYFSRVFKKQIGNTPSHYREILKYDKNSDNN